MTKYKYSFLFLILMKEELQQLGLTENESVVYIALLESGSTTAGDVIKKTKLHRNIVYNNLDKLIDKGLVTYVVIKSVKHFETTEPKELKEYIEKEKEKILEKEKLTEKIIPSIKEKRAAVERKQEATIFKGKKGLKTAIENTTNSDTEVLVFGTGWGLRETIPTYYEQWHLKLKENNIKGRILLPENRRKKYLEPFKARYLSEKNIIPSTICVYKDKVLNIVWGEEPTAVLIISEQNADSYRKYFEMLWNIGKE